MGWLNAFQTVAPMADAFLSTAAVAIISATALIRAITAFARAIEELKKKFRWITEPVPQNAIKTG
jgi:hypothetical protein